MTGIVIIGSGLSGYLLVKEIRSLTDVPITLITQNEGDYYTKPALSHLIRQNKSPQSMIMKYASEMAKELNVRILTHQQVVDIDVNAQTVFSDQGEVVSYTKLVFAIGARPNFPAKIQYQGRRPLVINQIEDWEKLGGSLDHSSSLAVLGAGLVGTEFVYDISGKKSLDWVFSEPWPLARFVPYQVGQWLKTNLKAFGVRPIQGLIQSIAHDGKFTVKVSDQSYQYDEILQALGLIPCIELAKKMGIDCGQGICVDRYMRTNQPNVFAMGDCAELQGVVLQYVAPIRIQAKALASTLCDQPSVVSYPAMMCTVKTPLVPVAFCVPPYTKGVWQIQACKDSGVKAYLYSNEQRVGFAVCGSYAKERANLIREMPDFLH